MKKVLVGIICTGALSLFANTPPEITNVRASQRADTKLVDIYYDAADADGDLLKVRVEISDNDGVRYSVPAFSLTGDIGEGVAPGSGKHIVWDAGTDWDGEYSDQMRVKVFAIDAKGFPGMEWGNEVPPGGFLMGQDGGAEGSGPSRHVNIPWSYWMGKYEVTCQQYCDFLNMALNNSYIVRNGVSNVVASTSIPVMFGVDIGSLFCQIGDDELIRWNINKFEPIGDGSLPTVVTWSGALAFARFYGYDLPTAAEWEKAARGAENEDAGYHLRYPWGDEVDSTCANITPNDNLTSVGYYDGNQVPIGIDAKNYYGLYDVVGNVAEWTLTKESEIEAYPQEDSLDAEINNPYPASHRIIKGYQEQELYGRKLGPENLMAVLLKYVYSGSSYSGGYYPSYVTAKTGFRVVRRGGLVNKKEPVLEVKEDFETWTITSSFGDKVVNTADGDWKLGSYVCVVSNDTLSSVGTNMLYCESSPCYIYLPTSKNKVIEIRLRVLNNTSYSRSIDIECGNDVDGYTSNSISIPKYSGWQWVSLSPIKSATTHRLRGDYLYIDDLEIWTIPRTNE